MNYDPKIHHRRSIRLEGYDYSQEGMYFVTICTVNKNCIFGNITDGEMVLNEMGTIVYNEWLQTPVIRKSIDLDVFVVMPNHIHGIIILRSGVCNEGVYKEGVCNTPLQSPTIGSIVRGYKSSVTGKINALNKTRGVVVWQKNYWEHIIRDLQTYTTISEYIINNPINWSTDKLMHPY